MRTEHLPQGLLAQRRLLEDLETADTVRHPVPGQIGDVGIELPQSMPGGVLAHQTGSHHRTVRIDDPPTGYGDTALIRVGVGEHLVAVQHRGAPAHTGLGQRVRPQARLPD